MTELADTTQTGLPLNLRNVRKQFAGGILAIDGISLDIATGEFVAILGPSGCGKSTLLRMIAGLDQPTSGEIVRPAGDVAYVFQDAHLLPWRSVLRNVALPLELRGVPQAQRLDAARRAIASVGLSEFEQHYPAQLSGGMKMRVSLARALVNQPSLLLLDEPFAALDEITRAHLDNQLRELWLSRGMTVLFVTHSITEAAFLANRAVVMSKRPGKLILDTPIDLGVHRSESLRGEPAFARQTGILLDALMRGGA